MKPNVLVRDSTELSRSEWLAMRRKGIGGSDCPKILGFSKFSSPLEVYWDKLNIPHEKYSDDDRWVNKRVGQILENVVIEVFEHLYPDWKVIRDHRMYQHGSLPWMIADLDAIAIHKPTGKQYIMECKTCNQRALQDWGPKNSMVVPLDYEFQGRHYMAVMNQFDGVLYACLALGGDMQSDFRVRLIMRDLEKEKILVKEEMDFWINHVNKRIDPSLSPSADVARIIRKIKNRYGKNDADVPLPLKFQNQLDEILQIDAEMKELNRKRENLKKRKEHLLYPILNYLQGANGYLSDGQSSYFISEKTRSSSSIKSDDLQKMMIEDHDLYMKYVSYKESGYWTVEKKADKWDEVI